jgi:cell division protein FtsN
MPLPVARLPLVSLAFIALLPACASVALNAPPPAPPAASTLPSDAERYPPPRPRDPPAVPIESPAVSLPDAPPVATPSAAAPLPLPPPSAIETAPTPAPTPVAAPAAEPAARAPEPVTPAAPTPAASAARAAPSVAPRAATESAAASAAAPGGPAGRWSVQVGVFAVARNAESARARTAERLADAGIAGTSVRTVEREGRTHVVVGALPDRASAQQLAARLRSVLQQDVVLFRW